MKSSSSDSPSSDNRSDDQLFRMDIESLGQKERAKPPGLAIRLWKIPLPLRRGHILSDLVKNVACLMTSL